jgi:RNA polymerase sigma-70 factor (ECF subfamily)
MEEDLALRLSRAFAMDDAESQRSDHSNEEVVTALYQELRPALLGYAYHLTGSTRESEDLVQIAFLQFFDHLSRRAEIHNVRGWIYRAVHSLAINHVTRSRHRDSLVKEWLADAVVEHPESVEDSLARRQEIENALQMVNERERHCLMLRAEGLSYREIADVLEISVKSVSVYLARGLKKFEARHDEAN